MAIHVALNHVTHYRYDRLVNLGPQVVRLRPAPHCRTPILSYTLQVEPTQHFINWQQDPFSNYLARLVFPDKTNELKITVGVVAEMAVFNPFDYFLEPSAENFPFKYEDDLREELTPYLAKGELTPHLKEFVADIDTRKQPTNSFLVSLNQRLQREVRYIVRMEPGVQTPDETLVLASGSCRDSAWLMVQALRQLGLAARFVSGYLIQLKPDVKSLDGPSGTEVDFTDLHAWCEVYLPGAGWVGLDPTSGLFAGEGHIPVACTPEPGSAAPISGAVDESEVEFSHLMEVTRIYESPRVTKPYTDDQWQKIVALGYEVDAELQAGDVRLTQGGEPTFVSIDDRDGAEWSIDALGPTKRRYAVELIRKLRNRYGPNGFLHFGQGKWYPGEQLPRWALSMYWRTDGEPCWHDTSLFADERIPANYTDADAKRFVETLATKLKVNPKYAIAGFEDVFYYLWRERRLPSNVDPFDSKLEDEMERNRLRRLFEAGLDAIVGYALPIQRSEAANGPRWLSGPWFLRDERMYLFPGDSPMGYRLPLDSLPWARKGDLPVFIERDPFAARDQLPAATQIRGQFSDPLAGVAIKASAGGVAEGGMVAVKAESDDFGIGGGDRGSSKASSTGADQAGRAPLRFESAGSIVRNALCIEVRDPRRSSGPKAEPIKDQWGKAVAKSGVLYVFMPPLQTIEDYLELLAAVEATAAELKIPVVIEGYQPPRDTRLKMLQVTPDPGVIEVNIHPASNWSQLTDYTEFLYQTAHETRLSSEKFLVDGKHTGTGGGNHFVLGGATPADSPFLRRPDLLGSLVSYWINHPSLSYLFSGMFIGPTSQAPRVDEARNDQLYELEIAFAQIAKETERWGSTPPWIVDRALRNILIDVTGNTHRTEFCIDKLYSPDGPTGRLGLLELRAFEMPPHARMSLAQQLLLRALIARFWKTPYTTRLTRWGTELHDRFLLPTFVQMDFDDIMTELNEAGYAFDRAWFAPHFEFRFPLYGEVTARGIELSIRGALEPWHVMGEEGSAGGTVRYVDGSLERVEVKVTGLNDNRYVVTVNGEALPLQPTGRVGEYVAGVRYKAWAPPSALHPTIKVHTPLTFDLVDTWMKRSLGGCQYHVEHPGGRNEERLPINAYEAESRRMARFFKFGHTPGKIDPARTQPTREFPFTVDLRQRPNA